MDEAEVRELMLRGMDGDNAAYRRLLDLLSRGLRAYFMRRLSAAPADVEDLVQETLLALHVRRASYDPARPFTAWAHAIARHKLIDFWRRRNLRATLPLDTLADFLAGASGAPDDALDLTRALHTLPSRQRELVEAVKIEGDSLAEAGGRLGMSEGAAKVALHRALKHLAKGMRHAD